MLSSALLLQEDEELSKRTGKEHNPRVESCSRKPYSSQDPETLIRHPPPTKPTAPFELRHPCLPAVQGL